MRYEATLPENFDGTFRFTNPTDEAFVGIWGGKEYHFPAMSTCPMIMPEFSPLEVQHIRKKFAKDLAEREFYKSKDYDFLRKQEKNDDGTPRLNSIQQAGSYSMDQLTPFIQRCLDPLPMAKVSVSEMPTVKVEEKLSRNTKGKLNSGAVGLGDEEGLERLARGIEE